MSRIGGFFDSKDRLLIVNIDDTTIADNVFIGYAAPNSGEDQPLWRMLRIQTNAGVMRILYADGNDLFDNIWNDRTTLTYQ